MRSLFHTRSGLIGCGLAAACAVVAIAGGGAPADGATAGRQAALKPAAGSCHLPHPPGQTEVPLTVGGRARPFALFVPQGYDGRTPLALVLNLHGSGSRGQAQMDLSALATVADEQGFAVAAPNGAVVLGQDAYAWNVPGVPLVSGQPVPAGTPSDERYLLRVMRAAGETICADADRVYVTGLSGGARMTSQFGCDFSARIAAIAPVAGLRAGVPEQTADGAWRPAKPTCVPDEPLPVLTFHGTGDGTNPYEGNDDARWGYSTEQALARWARLDHCRRGPAARPVTAIVDLVSYSKCRGGSSVALYREAGGAHVWPVAGAPEGAVDASRLIWKFFSRHSLGER
jgi:polyhydroxybutyrate depolymerase